MSSWSNGRILIVKWFKTNFLEPSLNSKDLDTLMAKLEQDNKILAELDCKLQNVTAIDSTEKPQNYSMSSSLPSLT
jgi:hypothetical protein